jgi:OmpR-family two-component system manganese-sensing sensor histidine kinase
VKLEILGLLTRLIFHLRQDVIIFSRIFPFQNLKRLGLRRRLLLTYLTTIAAILLISATVLYIFFSRNLNKELDARLLTSAQAAVPSLDVVKTEGRQGLDKDIAWRNLFSVQKESLEWFDADGRLLAKEGAKFPKIPLFQHLLTETLDRGSPLFQRQNQIRSVTLPIYADDSEDKILVLRGYIRASQSTEETDNTLARLLLALWLGGIILLILISLGSIYFARQALEPTQQNLRQLKQFAAEASHELRNPLTRISIASEVMLNNRDRFQPSDSRKLEMIDTATKQMQRLVDDLLFLIRTDNLEIATQRQKPVISLSELLQTLVSYTDSTAQAKRITLEVNLTPDLSVRGDNSQLNRLFSNLLENAIKYTESGGKVTISLSQVKKFAVVTVEDTGVGIPTEYLPFLFQRFWRVEQDRNQQQEGFGLGLAIAQTIVQQHQGKISVTSELGVGSCFQVSFPLVE